MGSTGTPAVRVVDAASMYYGCVGLVEMSDHVGPRVVLERRGRTEHVWFAGRQLERGTLHGDVFVPEPRRVPRLPR